MQVKKEVLDKLDLDSSPGTLLHLFFWRYEYLALTNILTNDCFSVKCKKTKGIAVYFSKRCLPPEEAINALASSPELRLKSKTIQNGNGGTEAPQINLFPSSQ